jgi:hypothetical protein
LQDTLSRRQSQLCNDHAIIIVLDFKAIPAGRPDAAIFIRQQKASA